MDIKLNFKGGGSFVALRPQFSSDSESLFVAWKNQILSYNSKTGKLISTLKGIQDNIIGFSVHKLDGFECVTACSVSGVIISWKVSTQFKILTAKVNRENIKTFNIIPCKSNESAKALISYKKQKTILFALYELQNNSLKNYDFIIEDRDFHLDVNEKIFAVCYNQRFTVVNLSNFTRHFTHAITQGRHFTQICCHPEEDSILTGDSSGRAVLWQNIFTSRPTQAVYHWHTLPISSITFSTSGSYFYTGGNESVLVKWDIENSNNKKFLPRLPAGINHINVSPDNVYVAIALSNNGVKIVNSVFEDVCLVQNLVIGDQYESGIVFDPRTRALIMNGNIGHVQFYLPEDTSLLYNVAVVGQNKITNERNCNIENTQVTKVAISKSGQWMATIEERKDTEFSNEVRLKFWNFNLEIQNFILNTSVELPHENKVHSLLFQPLNNESEIKCVTVGDDKKFRIWQIVDTSTIYRKGSSWKCLYTGFYRDLPCNSLSFSIDGSLVAISFMDILTTWLPDTCELKCSLVHPSYKDKITHLEFGTSNQCHLIVTASKERICVWNLLTLTMIWTVAIKVSLLIADTVTTNMAVFTPEQKIVVFSPSSHSPIFSSSTLLSPHKGIVAATFVPSKYSNDMRLPWHQRSPIYFIDSQKELFSIGVNEETSDAGLNLDDIDQSLFSMMIPNVKTNKTKKIDLTHHFSMKDAAQKNIKKYFEAPLHTMIPIRIMCAPLLKSLVLQKNNV